ncbi:UDP-glycosyltransferase UGT5-like [Episyrphus balteatus]|uniref:UDP-glycosyltransferase UGT5-like n=1 Tax=Episyrphus balteatus TaxID=286459 RepID=UPI00248652F6|nr:UDP-glycosyltransferase UGT5-like [Episyrphus balteatus]
MKSQIILLMIFSFVHFFKSTESSNILGVFLTHSPSNVIHHMAVARALIERGHNLTVITSIPLKEKNPGYRHIFLKQQELSQKDMDTIINDAKTTPVHLKIFKVYSLIKKIINQYSEFTSDPDFIDFLKEENHFDLMILGYAFNDLPLGIAAHFKCPVVMSFPIQPFGHVSRMIGNPTHTAFVPFSPFMESSQMDLSRRIINVFLSTAERILTAVLHFFSERLYEKNFPSDRYRTLSEMKENISLILFNHHFSEGPVRPLVPGLVEIGGIQIKDKPNPLPKNIEKFLENSEKGAILFSLGSNVREHHLGPNGTEIIFKVLSNLPYKILWKFDGENLPGNSTNIYFSKWLPQDDILAHKNIKLFINHGGKGSITEAEYHEVPMVALPVYGDHPKNAAIMQNKGHGIVLDYRTLTEESFRKTIMEVLENEKYKNAVQKFSRVYRDRPITARENAVYWIEYVIRHSGAQHMQSPLKYMNFFEANSLDVFVILCCVIYLIVKFVNMFVMLSFKMAEKMVEIAQKEKQQ